MQYIHQRSNYGFDAYASYLRTADGKAFDSGTAAIVVNGVARRLAVTPSLFLPGDGGSRSNLISGKLYHSLSATSRVRFGAGWIDSPLAYYSTPGAGSTLAGGVGTISDRPSRAVFGEGQWTWTPHGAHTLTAGTELRHDSTAVAETSVPNYTRRSEGGAPAYNAGGKAFNQGAYVQHQWRPAERWMIVWGGRYDYWRSYDGLNETVGTTLSSRYGANATHSGSGKAAVVYRAPGDVAVRTSFGNAFRNPTVYDLYRTWRSSTSVVYAANPALTTETLVAWEAGATRRFRGGFELDGAFYVNWVDGLIYRSTDLAADPRGLYRPMVNAAGVADARH